MQTKLSEINAKNPADNEEPQGLVESLAELLIISLSGCKPKWEKK